MKIGIIPDSTCDIPDALLEQYGIVVVPQRVVWGITQYRDRIDLQPVEFYRRLAVEPDLPHSSMPSNLRIAVLHGNVPDEAAALAERIEAEVHPLELLVNITGPVLGINTGPGALALCGYAE